MFFESPLFLILFLFLPPLVLWEIRAWRIGQSGLHQLFTQILIQRPWQIRSLIFLKALLCSIVILMLAGPTLREYRSQEVRNGVNIVFVLDISRSMLAEDITPNRLESAKSTLASFLSRERGNRVGLIVFAGKPFTTAPLSYDYGALQTIIRSLSVNYILQDIDGLSGTAFGDALLIAGEMFGSGTSASGNIIIALTDGRANTGVDPLLASQLLRESGIRVFPIGIGSISGTTLFVTNKDGKREYFRDSTGAPLIADLDEATLEKVAEITGGKYWYSGNASTLESIFSTLHDITKQPLVYEKVSSDYPINAFLFPPILFLLLSLPLLEFSLLRKYRIPFQ